MKLFLRSCLGGVLAAGLWLAPSPAEAAPSLRLGFGADYWFIESATFQFTLGIETALNRTIHIGGRFGALLVTDADTLGIPADLVVRAQLPRQLYVEGLVGPWLFFEGDTFRGHGALGFGLQGKELSFGLELGYLSPDPTIGLRLGYRF
jgi:hypothetical protein